MTTALVERKRQVEICRIGNQLVVVMRNDRGHGVVFLVGGGFLVLAAATADGDVSEGPTFGPVATTCLAKVAWLG